MAVGLGGIAILGLALPSQAASAVYLDAATAKSLASTMPRPVNAHESTYFVFTDRYANGSEDNDFGAGQFQGGFDPKSTTAFHGGDFIGLSANLQRIKSLGFNSIWITPPVANQPKIGNYSGFHGYWGIDFTKVDPHLGTDAEFKAFVDKAHSMGMKVIMDIVVNHTGDVITYLDDKGFVSPSDVPYKDAAGTPFDVTEAAKYTENCTALGQTGCFPLMNLDSFQRSFMKAGGSLTRSPAFLNDLTNYHNVGDNSDCGWAAGECATFGDFLGLDDLFTEKPDVVKGMSDVYASWVTRFGIDGFRIDTAKHPNKEFFDYFVPAVNAAAKEAGKGELTMYGEAWLTNAGELSDYYRKRALQSTLDFPMQGKVDSFAAGATDGAKFSKAFAWDDYFNTGNAPGTVRNAYGLTTFLGNHDMGRSNALIAGSTSDLGKSLVSRVNLANSVMFLMRGAPSVYYGDEVGILGNGGDAGARQDLMPTQVMEWQLAGRLGGDAVGKKGFLGSAQLKNPIAVNITALQALRNKYPALKDGAMVLRYGSGSVVAWSRISAKEKRDYLVLVNNGTKSQTVTVPVSNKSTTFASVFGAKTSVKSTTKYLLKVTVPARSSLVLRAASTLPVQKSAPVAKLSAAFDYLAATPMLTATVKTTDPVQVTFVARPDSNSAWQVIGVDDAPSYRFLLDPWVWGDHASMQFSAITRTSNGATAGGQVITVNRADVSGD